MRVLFGKNEVLIYLPQFNSEDWSMVVEGFMSSLDNPLTLTPIYDCKDFVIRVPFKGALSNIALVGLKQLFTQKCFDFIPIMSAFFRVGIVRAFVSDFSKKNLLHLFNSNFYLKDYVEADLVKLKAFIWYLVSTVNPKASDCRVTFSKADHIKVVAFLDSDLSCSALNHLFLSALGFSDV